MNHVLTLNRPGFLRTGMAGGGQILPPLCNFCLDAPIDLNLACRRYFEKFLYIEKKLENSCQENAQNANISIFRALFP